MATSIFFGIFFSVIGVLYLLIAKRKILKKKGLVLIILDSHSLHI